MKCSSCGKESIGNTSICVHCGALMGGVPVVVSSVAGDSLTPKPLASQPRIPAMQSGVSQAIREPDSKVSSIWLLVGTVLVGVILLALGVVMSKNGSESKTSASTPSVKTEAPSTGNVAHDRQEWYSGGLSDSTSMSEWTHASNRDQLATAAAIAVMGLELKYGSTRAAVQKLGTMESLLPYAVEVLECMNTAVKGSPDITDADWQKILEKQTVRDFGVGCLAMLKVQGGANSDF